MSTPVILASSSPYRAKQLAQLNVSFDCIAPEIDEELEKNKNLSPRQLSKNLAQLKALTIAKQYPNSIVIGGDQVCALDSSLFNKPINADNAVKQLTELQGKSHQLFTSIAVYYKNHQQVICVDATLAMKALSLEKIQHYIKLDNPLDCCGSYKLEQHGISLFESIQCDDFSAITGLPLMALTLCLENLGLSIP